MKNVLRAIVSEPLTEHARFLMMVTIVYLVELALLAITALLALNGVALNITVCMAVVVLPIYKSTHAIQVIK